MTRVEIWSAEDAKKKLQERLSFAKQVRKPYEREWQQNEEALFSRQELARQNVPIYTPEGTLDTPAVDEINVNYIMKDLRYIHSQLSLNPPSVIPRPVSNDNEDKRRADAADRLVRYALRQYSIQEVFDQASWAGLTYGTAFIKGLFDPYKGEIADFNPATGEVVMEGDYAIEAVSPWEIFPDADAKTWAEVSYVFQEHHMRYEEACYRFPEAKELFEKIRQKDRAAQYESKGEGKSRLNTPKHDVLKIYQYWEKGLPYNGMVGRFCWCTEDGDLVTPVMPNPYAFKARPGAKMKVAQLPYHIFTDLDIPGTYWGRSVVNYAAPLQTALNKIDTVTLDILKAHGVARLMVPEGTEISDESITNSPYDVVKYAGNVPPSFMEPMPLPAAMPNFRESMKMAIDDTMGINESMFGQQSREQSGFSMQYATQQGNIIRRRMFNKYVLLVESVYKGFINVVCEFWKEPRTIKVLGKEKAFEVMDLAGADIDGGFDIVVEYGTSLSLDPMARREEILTLMPLFEKAGIQPRALLGLMKLNELDGAFDLIQLAADRQREIFEEMEKTGIYIPPAELQDHTNMLTYAYYYLMTAEFKYLPDEAKVLIEQHIKEREQLAAQGAAGGATGQPPAPAQPPAPGAPPAGGMALPPVGQA